MLQKIAKYLIYALIATFVFYKIFAMVNSKSSGDLAPNFTEELIDGTTFTLSEQKGKYLLISFWGSWCAPCIQDAPNMVKLYNKYENQKFYDAEEFEIVSIAIEKNEKRTRGLINKLNLHWKNHIIQTSAFVLKAPLALKYNVTDLPTKILIAPDGKIVKNKISIAEVDDYLNKKLK